MMTTTRVRTAGKLTTTATVMLVLTAKLMLTRLPMATDTPPKALLMLVMPMQVPKDQGTKKTALTTTPVERAAGVPKLLAGPMLVLMETAALPNTAVVTLTPTRVLMPTETRTLMLLVTAMPKHTDMDVTDPALTRALADGVAGKLESTAPPTLMLLLKVTLNTVLTVATGKMPAVTATLLQTPLESVPAHGAHVLRVQLMPLLTRMVSRPATGTEVIPRTPMVMNMVLLMPALADTVAATLMAVALVLLATLPTLVDEVLPRASVLLVEIVQLVLVEVVMPVSTLELVATLVRDMALVALDLPLLVAMATPVMVPMVIEETTLTLVHTATELQLLVLVAVPMAALQAMVLMENTDLVATADPLDTAELPVTADLLATADTLTATVITDMAVMAATETPAMERVATLIQVPTDSAATLEMMVIMELVIELSELSKQLLKEDTIPPISGN